MSDGDDKSIEIWKIKKLVKSLAAARGCAPPLLRAPPRARNAVAARVLHVITGGCSPLVRACTRERGVARCSFAAYAAEHALGADSSRSGACAARSWAGHAHRGGSRTAHARRSTPAHACACACARRTPIDLRAAARPPPPRRAVRRLGRLGRPRAVTARQ